MSNNSDSEIYTFNYSAEICTCSVYAAWHPVQLSIYPGSDANFHSQDDMPYPSGAPPYIQIDIDWANLAVPPSTAIEELATRLNSNNNLTSLDAPFGSTVSILLADAIARIGLQSNQSMAEKFDILLDITVQESYRGSWEPEAPPICI